MKRRVRRAHVGSVLPTTDLGIPCVTDLAVAVQEMGPVNSDASLYRKQRYRGIHDGLQLLSQWRRFDFTILVKQCPLEPYDGLPRIDASRSSERSILLEGTGAIWEPYIISHAPDLYACLNNAPHRHSSRRLSGSPLVAPPRTVPKGPGQGPVLAM